MQYQGLTADQQLLYTYIGNNTYATWISGVRDPGPPIPNPTHKYNVGDIIIFTGNESERWQILAYSPSGGGSYEVVCISGVDLGYAYYSTVEIVDATSYLA